MEYSEDELKKIGQKCHQDYLDDEAAREEWLSDAEKWIELANQTCDEKSFPWKGASNIKLPMILDASIKFASRAYGEIIPGEEIVRSRIINTTPEKMERSKRVTQHMSWQLLEKEENWEADTDKLLHMVPIIGHIFRKRFYCPRKQRSDSQLIMPTKICCSEDGRRKTHILTDTTHSELTARQRAGEWRDIKLKEEIDFLNPPTYEILEQHCWLDIDEDGYEEPYVVTFDKETTKVLSVSPRYTAQDITFNQNNEITNIDAIEYFIDYTFIPNFTGGYYGVGFGQLLGPLSLAANSIMNQLVDAGTLANVQGGFLDEKIKIISGRQNFELGEWKKVTTTGVNGRLADGVLPLPAREPSPTLFSLLGLIIDLTKDLGSIKDVLSGDAPAANVPATTVMALIEQGMKTFNTIYKRLYRSLKKEFKLLYRINSMYLDMQEYYEFNDEKQPIYQEDYSMDGLDIIPQADPQMSTDIQRMAKAEAIKQILGMPGVNNQAILTIWLQALKLNDNEVQMILNPPQPAPDPKMLEMQQKLEIEDAKITIEEEKVRLEAERLDIERAKAQAEISRTYAQGVKDLAIAEAQEVGNDLQAYKLAIEGMKDERLERSSNNATVPNRDSRPPQPTDPTTPNTPGL